VRACGLLIMSTATSLRWYYERELCAGSFIICLFRSEHFKNLAHLYLSAFAFRLLGYEGVEVINPEGGKEDAEEEAQRGRWKQEVFFLSCLLPLSVLSC
jgi:hypothetical protein